MYHFNSPRTHVELRFETEAEHIDEGTAETEEGVNGVLTTVTATDDLEEVPHAA